MVGAIVVMSFDLGRQPHAATITELKNPKPRAKGNITGHFLYVYKSGATCKAILSDCAHRGERFANLVFNQPLILLLHRPQFEDTLVTATLTESKPGLIL